MHLFAIALLPPNFWNTFAVDAPVKIIAIAGALCTLIQLVKIRVPQLGGYWAIGMNLVLSIAGVLSLTKPEDMLTLSTAANILVVALGGAGMHGTAKLMGSSSYPVDIAPRAPSLASRAILLTLLFVACVSVSGCMHNATAAAPPPLPIGAVDQTDAKANQTLQTIHAFSARVSGDILAGSVRLSSSQRLSLDRLNAGLNTADAAEQAYHAAGGGDAAKLDAAVAAVQTAFAQTQALMATPVTH